MIYLKRKYASQFTSLMPMGEQVDSDTWNFRCPVCGDSKKDPKKARGYIYSLQNDLLYKCHNCGESTTFTNILKQYAPGLFKEYLTENFKHRNHPGQKPKKKQPNKYQDPPAFKKKDEDNAFRSVGIDLASEHPEAIEYLKERCIPEEHWSRIFFTKKQRTSELWMLQERERNIYYDPPAIVFKLHDKNGSLAGVQFRIIDPESKKRYKIRKFRSVPLYFGTDECLNPKYVVEGPFDSFFLPDCIAVCGSDMVSANFDEDTVYILDCDNRNKEIIKKYRKLLNMGRRVTILPERYSGMDLNDMFVAGLTTSEIESLVKENTYQGMSGLARLSEWKRI